MGCDYYTEDAGGSFEIEILVETEEEGCTVKTTKTVSIAVPPDSKVYLDKNVGDYERIHPR